MCYNIYTKVRKKSLIKAMILRDRAEVARQPHKLEAVGSIPSPATTPAGEVRKHRVGGVSKAPPACLGRLEIGDR